MDILTAKGIIETGDLSKMKESVEFLKTEGTAEHIALLKQARHKLPAYETALIESIDAAIDAITARCAGASTGDGPSFAADADAARKNEAPQADAQFPDAPAGESNEERSDGYRPLSDGGNGSLKSGDFPQNEYLDKVKDIWEKGKSAAIKNATLIKMKSQLNTIKNDKLVQLKHLGETVYNCFAEAPSSVAFIDDGIAGVREIDKKIARKQEEEKEIEESRAEGGFWNVVKSSISKFAGYTKIKLDISILQSNRESKLSALGQLIYDRLGECERIISKHATVNDVLATIKDLDRQREEKEAEIAEISQAE